MTENDFSIEILLAAYNNVVATRLCLDGFLRQSDQDFSIAIADDGSGPEIAGLAEAYRDMGLSIRHLWQEDDGFRKSRIMNRAISSSAADYILFIDNDCIPQRDYVADHRRVAQRGHFVAGRRINLGPELSNEFRHGDIPIAKLDSRLWLLKMALSHRLRHAEFGLRLPWLLARLWSRKPRGLLGANMAIWREDLLRINGFDNDIPGGCGEEIDLEWRLRATGVEGIALLGRAGVAHLDHPIHNGDPAGREYRFGKIARNEVRAIHGIESLE